jgi:hypothetical protein
LIPELQGRLPIRVELEALNVEDFVRPDRARCLALHAVQGADGDRGSHAVHAGWRAPNCGGRVRRTSAPRTSVHDACTLMNGCSRCSRPTPPRTRAPSRSTRLCPAHPWRAREGPDLARYVPDVSGPEPAQSSQRHWRGDGIVVCRPDDHPEAAPAQRQRTEAERRIPGPN